MRMSKMLGTLACVLVLMAGGDAMAGAEHYAVQVKGDALTLNTTTNWHINQDFPWKLTCGEQITKKDRFTLTETSAKVSGGKGDCSLKGAVCTEGTCEPFTAAVKF